MITKDRIASVAARAPQDLPPAPMGDTRWDARQRLDASTADLNAAGIALGKEKSLPGGTRLWELSACPLSDAHTDGASLYQFPSGYTEVKCHHNSCDGKGMKDAPGFFTRTLQIRPLDIGPTLIAGGEKVSAAIKGEVPAERNCLFLTAREIAAVTPARPLWRVEPWLVSGGITEVSGKVKSAGKTTWVLAMVSAMLAGREFLGYPTEPGAVIYLTEQQGPSLREALARAELLEREDLHILQWHATSGMPWATVVLEARQRAKDTGAVLLVVDTLPQFAGLKGDAENNSGAALEAIAPLQQAAADGLAVLIIRHDRKGGGEVGDSARGSSAFAGAVDVVLQVQRGDGNTRPTIRVINALSRFTETPDQLMIELTPEGYVALGDKGAVAAQEAQTALLAAAPTTEPDALAERELFEATDTKRTIGQEALRALVSAGKLTRTGEGKRGKPYRYWRNTTNVSAGSPVDAAERNATPPPASLPKPEKLSAGTSPLIAAERNAAPSNVRPIRSCVHCGAPVQDVNSLYCAAHTADLPLTGTDDVREY